MPHNFRKSYFAPGTEGHKVINLQRTVGSLGFFIARQSPENGWDSFWNSLSIDVKKIKLFSSFREYINNSVIDGYNTIIDS